RKEFSAVPPLFTGSRDDPVRFFPFNVGNGPTYYPFAGFGRTARGRPSPALPEEPFSPGVLLSGKAATGYSSLSSHLPDSIGNNYFTTEKAPRQTVLSLGHAKGLDRKSTRLNSSH